MQIRDKLLRRYFFIYRIIIPLMFFLNVFPEINCRDFNEREFAFLNLASAINTVN